MRKPKHSSKIKTRKHHKKSKSKTQRVFTKHDFYSGDGFLTSIWGPTQWHMLHTISFNYPIHPTKEDKIHYSNHIKNLIYILPCKFCRQNLHTNLKQLPITNDVMKDRNSFSRYVYNLHELVNKMLKKSSNLTYCDVRERYEHFRSRCTDPPLTLFKYSKLKHTRKQDEKGCTEPLYGKKSRCIINIVPQGGKKGQSIRIDKKCNKKR